MDMRAIRAGLKKQVKDIEQKIEQQVEKNSNPSPKASLQEKINGIDQRIKQRNDVDNNPPEDLINHSVRIRR